MWVMTKGRAALGLVSNLKAPVRLRTALPWIAVHDARDPEYTILKQRLARRLRYEGADESQGGWWARGAMVRPWVQWGCQPCWFGWLGAGLAGGAACEAAPLDPALPSCRPPASLLFCAVRNLSLADLTVVPERTPPTLPASCPLLLLQSRTCPWWT